MAPAVPAEIIKSNSRTGPIKVKRKMRGCMFFPLYCSAISSAKSYYHNGMARPKDLTPGELTEIHVEGLRKNQLLGRFLP